MLTVCDLIAAHYPSMEIDLYTHYTGCFSIQYMMCTSVYLYCLIMNWIHMFKLK